MPHSNILLAIGAATLSMNIARICGSLRRKFTASCSLCDFGCCRSCHNCSQDEFWYFWTDLVRGLVQQRVLAVLRDGHAGKKQHPKRRCQRVESFRPSRLALILLEHHGDYPLLFRFHTPHRQFLRLYFLNVLNDRLRSVRVVNSRPFCVRGGGTAIVLRYNAVSGKMDERLESIARVSFAGDCRAILEDD